MKIPVNKIATKLMTPIIISVFSYLFCASILNLDFYPMRGQMNNPKNIPDKHPPV